ncbi:MAG: SPOR domain-containing protein [Bacteroidales bacterium]|nr:SPOR domain-containing protein [Bacteroidales bacterium]
MKKLALISGLLFLVVYFCVNTFITEENSSDVIYPSIPVRSLSGMDDTVTSVRGNPDPMTNSNMPTNYSYLIVASFNDIEKANRVAEEYGDKYNIDMHVLPPAANGYYRISYGRYTTTGEALAALETLKQKNFPDAWLLTSQ